MSVRKQFERFKKYTVFAEFGRTGLLVSIAGLWIVAMRGIRVEPGRSQESLVTPTVALLGVLCAVFGGLWYMGRHAQTRVRVLGNRLALEWRDYIMANPDAVFRGVSEYLAKRVASVADQKALLDAVIEVLIRFKSPRSGYSLVDVRRLQPQKKVMGYAPWEALVHVGVLEISHIAELPGSRFSDAAARVYWSSRVEREVLAMYPVSADFDVKSTGHSVVHTTSSLPASTSAS